MNIDLSAQNELGAEKGLRPTVPADVKLYEHRKQKNRAELRKVKRSFARDRKFDKANQFGGENDLSCEKESAHGIAVRYHRKIKSFNSSTHVEEQAGSLLEINFKDLLKHEELIIDVCLFGCTISICRDLRSMFPAVGLLLNKYLHKGMRGEILHIADWIRSEVTHTVNEQAATEIDTEFQSTQRWWSAIRNSDIWKDIYKVLSYVTCVIVHGFDLEKLKNVKKYVCDTRLMKTCESVKFVDTIGSIVTNVCTRVQQSYQSGDFLSFFHSAGSYQQWFNETYEVFRIDNAERDNADFDRYAFLKRVMDLIAQGKEIIRVQESKAVAGKRSDRKDKSREVVLIHGRVTALYDLQFKLQNEMNSVKLREVPYSSLVCGPSAVGKSSFTEIMRRQFAAVQGLANIPAYVRNPALKHWDGWESYYWGIIFDDIACFKPEAMNGIDPSIESIIQVINPISCQPPRADLKDKGKAAIQAKMVTLTSNVLDINADHYFSHTAAVLRRCGYQILLEVAPEFRSKTSQGLDPRLANHGESDYPDWWEITVREPVTRKKDTPEIREGNMDDMAKEECKFQIAAFEVDGQTLPLYKIRMPFFLEWFNWSVRSHFDNQMKIMNSQKKINSVNLCEHILPRDQCRECRIQEQAGVVPYIPFYGEEFSLNEFFGIHWELTKKLWAEMHLDRVIATVTFLLLTNHPETQSNICYRIRNRVYGHFIWIWETLRAFASLWLGASFGPILMFPCILFFYSILHPFDTWSLVTGHENSYFQYICQLLEYFQSALLLYVAAYCDRMVDAVHAMGLKTEYLLGGSIFCIAVLYAVVKMIKLFYSMYQSVEEQGQAHSFGKKFEVSGEKESVYVRPRTELDILDIPRHSLSLKCKTPDEIAEFYGPNLFHIGSKDAESNCNEMVVGNALFVRGHLCLVHTHVLQPGARKMLRFTIDSGKGVTKNFVSYNDEGNFQPLGEHLTLMNIQNAPLRKDLTLSLPAKTIRQFHGGGYLLKRNLDGTLRFNIVFNIQYVDSIFGQNQAGWTYKPNVATKNGDCGSLLFAGTPSGPVLIGLHQYGNLATGEGGATDLTTLEEVIVSISQESIAPGDVLHEKGRAGNLGDLHPKSIACTVQQNVPAEVYGSYDGFRQRAKSRVERTIFAPKLEEQGFVIEHGPPDMSYVASNKHFEKLLIQEDDRRIDIQREAMLAFLDYVTKHRTQEWEDQCHMVDQETSINGQPGVRFVDAINLSTSVGHPYSESKKKHLYTESGDWNDVRKVLPHIQEDINRIWDNYENGRNSNPISKASLKDEARTFTKIEQKNTRVFYGGQMSYTIVQRQLFLWFVRLVQRNPFIFKMAPGMDASGPQWHELWEYLFDFSDKAIAGDYQKFDITMSAEEMHLAYEFIVLLGKILGASELHVRMMRACAEDSIHVLIDYFATLIRTNCNPSGHALTVIINGLVNIIRVITAYVLTSCDGKDIGEIRRLCHEFFEYVHLIVYGDDNAMTVKERDHFNHTTMQEVFQKMGIGYTMAEKEAVTVPYITEKETTFLKRSFRFEAELGKYVAPLDPKSMVKMIALMIPSKVESKEQQLIQSLLSCHREAFFHGKEFFTKWDHMLQNFVRGTEIEIMMCDFPTWEYYIDWYRKKDCVETQDGMIFQQAGAVCERCGYECYFINYQDENDLRKCQFCKHCRFDEPDLDCLYCGLEDSCEHCGTQYLLEKTCDFEIRGEKVRLFEGKCLLCKYKKSFMRLLTERPNGLGRGDSVSLNQNTSL